MIYLDYAAETPVNREVLQTFCSISEAYIANPNSTHRLGKDARARLDLATDRIAELLKVKESEIIYTSGASESNNLAIKGIAKAYKKHGRHIISTYLEHSSVTGAITALQNDGFEVDYINILESGLVDLQHLKDLLREDTILVSIGYVDSEIGIKQPISQIKDLLSAYPHCFFHVDAVQAVGKIPVKLGDVDLVTLAPHKFYGLPGCGILIKKQGLQLEPLIHGGKSTTAFRSGTPTLALICAAEKALDLAYEDLELRYNYVKSLNEKLKESLKQFNQVSINSSQEAVPHILNISIKGVNTVNFQNELESYGVFVSTKSACCAPNTVSRPVYALTKDRKRALATLRMSLSHLTTFEEIDQFLNYFEQCYKKSME